MLTRLNQHSSTTLVNIILRNNLFVKFFNLGAQNYNLNRGHFGSEVLNGMNPNSLQGRADLIAYYGQRLDQRIRDGPIGLGWTEASYRVS